MDPNANLDEQQRLVEVLLDSETPDIGDLSREQLEEIARNAQRLAVLIQALDGWLKCGGFLPEGWKR